MLAIERSRIPPVIITSATDLAIIIPMLYEDHSEKITKPPITIAIQAPWGQGKTSLMTMIQKKIDPEHVHFDKESSAKDVEPKTSTTFRKLFEWAKSDKNKNLQPE